MKKAIGMLTFALAGILLYAAAPAEAVASVQAASAGSYDFSNENVAQYQTKGEVELLEQYLDTPLSDAERNYLNAQGEFSLRYSDAVGISNVLTQITEEGGLSLTAHTHSYRAVGGRTVVWTPLSADGEALTQEGEEYRWSRDTLPEDSDFVTVAYGTSFSIAAADVNLALNRAYYAAQDIRAKQTAYDEELSDYRAKVAAHEKYLADLAQYESDLADYNAYRTAKREWDTKNTAYQNYLKALEKYQSDLKAYEDFEAYKKWYYEQLDRYIQYNNDYEQYLKDYDEYLASLTSPEARLMLRQIEYLDFMFAYTLIPGQDARNLYNAVMGNTVMSVLANKDAIVQVIPSLSGALDLAESATLSLRRSYLPMYYSIKNSDTKTKYFYYISCYDGLAKEITSLLQALDKLYANDTVREYIENYGRTEQYRILLAQLYVLANLLTDDRIPDYDMQYGAIGKYFDDSYRIGRDKPADLLRGTVIPEDTNEAAPLPDGYYEVPEPPVAPTPVADPGPIPSGGPSHPGNPPKEVANPGAAPKEVKEPVKPAEVPMPAEPTPYTPSAEEAALAAAYQKGEIALRAETKESYDFAVQTEVIRFFRNATIVVIEFYLQEYGAQQSAAYAVEAPLYSYVEFPLELPVKSRTGYTCTFAGWVDREGNSVDLNRLDTTQGTLALYPKFTETPNEYSVNWTVNGETFYDLCAYDAIPAYISGKVSAVDGRTLAPLEKTSNDGFLYRFRGWWRNGSEFFAAGEALPAMTEARVFYEAVFEKSALVVWRVDGSADRITPVWAGDTPSYGVPVKETDGLYGYTFAHWSLEREGDPVQILPVEEGEIYRYYAVFTQEYLFGNKNGGASVSFADGYYTVNAARLGVGPYTVSGLLALAHAASAEAGEEIGVAIRLSNGNIYLSEAIIYELISAGASTLSVVISQRGEDYYRFRVLFEDEAGNSVVPESTLRFEAYARFTVPTSDLHLYRTDDETPAGFERAETVLTIADMTAGAYYEIYPQYSVVVSVEGTELSVSALLARPGEVVTVTVGPVAVGSYLAEVYYRYDVVNEEGKRETVSVAIENGAFVMPSYTIVVGVSIAFYEYTVEFRFDGKTLLKRSDYKYGDTVALPPVTPVKASDDTYSYTFSHWVDAEGNRINGSVTVTGDAVYEAVFTAALLPPPEEQGHSKLYYIVMAVEIGGPVFVVLVIALVVFLVVRHRRKKRAVQRENLPNKEKNGEKSSE